MTNQKILNDKELELLDREIELERKIMEQKQAELLALRRMRTDHQKMVVKEKLIKLAEEQLKL